MQFLYPGVLWGLLALGIPLLIHLFNFRKTKKVFFTNVAFLKKVDTETSSFRKLKQWVIMAARMLFIACLVLAFAQPFLPAKNQNGIGYGGVTGLYLDNSLSMQNTVDNKRFIDLAIGKIDQLLTLFKNQQNLQFGTNDFAGEDQFVQGATKLRERLAEVRFAVKPRTIAAVFNRQFNLAEKIHPGAQNSFFLFSDFQKSTTGNLQDLKPNENQKVFLVPVQGEETHNVYVDSIWLSTPFVREMQNTTLNVRVFNSGNTALEKLPITLSIDGKQASATAVAIGANSYADARFNFAVNSKGEHRGTVTFDDQPVTFDNEGYFVFTASPAIRILHLYQERNQANYLGKLYANDSLFQYAAYPAGSVDPERIKQADLIILEGVRLIDANLQLSLTEAMKAGGSVVLIPASNPDQASYTQLVNAVGIHTLSTLENQSKMALSEPDKRSPFYGDVFEQSSLGQLLNLPEEQIVMKWAGVYTRLLGLRNGNDFLTVSAIGAGKLYVQAAPLLKAFGNFGEHALFVPTYFKIASLSAKPQQLAYAFSGGTIAVPMKDATQNTIFELRNGDFSFIPIQRVQGDKLLIELPAGDEIANGQELQSGFYELVNDGKVKKTIALNHDSDESQMEVYSPDELRELVKGSENIEVYDSILDNDFVDTFASQNIGKDLWRYFIYAALFFLLLEILLVRFWFPKK